MQIDILSSNTLKLTLSKLDMFDLDIKYESLSGKNPETKRLLAHVLKSIRLDQKAGFDFSCERVFVEAFPRPDGGCMLYISSLETDGGKRKKIQQKPRESALDSAAKPETRGGPVSHVIFETDGFKEIGAVCRNLCWHKDGGRLGFDSALYIAAGCGGYRLVINGNNVKLLSGIIREYGEILKGEKELLHTKEYFNPLIPENAAEIINDLF